MLPPLAFRYSALQPFARTLEGQRLSWKRDPAYTGSLSREDGLGGLELALGGGAVALGHFGEALTLAGVRALTLAFASGVGRRRYGRAGQKQGRGGDSERGTRLGIQLHDDLLDDFPMRECTPWHSGSFDHVR